MIVESVILTSPLRVEAIGKDSWVLVAPVTATVNFEGGGIEHLFVPAGFETDLASVPRLPLMFLLFGDKARRSAVLHDYLYSVRVNREYADAVFYAAMRHEEPAWRRALMWAGVRLGGWIAYAKPAAP